MATHFHPLTVARVTPDAAGSAAITLAVPAGLRDVFDFKPGQFLTLRAEIAGQETRRSYSICSPHERYRAHGEMDIGIKPVAGGVFSRWALAATATRRGHRSHAAGRPLHVAARRRQAPCRLRRGLGHHAGALHHRQHIGDAARCDVHPGLRQPARQHHHVQRSPAGPQGPLSGAARAGASAVAAGAGGGTAATAASTRPRSASCCARCCRRDRSTRCSCADPKA